ncbi:MAG: hypothetical protein CMG64_05120, partial [Candidatus Marinimicrobia bacterium]|nr:hypothetical protein [Candidatus Neomarinimicrobiota bacterium]
GCNGDSKTSENTTDDTNKKTETASEKTEKTVEEVENVDICRCLSEPGNTDWYKQNRYTCRDAISARLGVENWEAVSLNPKVSAGFDRLVKECGY